MDIGINPFSELKRLLYQWVWHKADIGQVGWEPLLAFLLVNFFLLNIGKVLTIFDYFYGLAPSFLNCTNLLYTCATIT